MSMIKLKRPSDDSEHNHQLKLNRNIYLLWHVHLLHVDLAVSHRKKWEKELISGAFPCSVQAEHPACLAMGHALMPRVGSWSTSLISNVSSQRKGPWNYPCSPLHILELGGEPRFEAQHSLLSTLSDHIKICFSKKMFHQSTSKARSIGGMLTDP